MKNYKFAVILLVFLVAVLSSYFIKTEIWDQNFSDKQQAGIKFFKQSYDLGTIEKSDEAEVYFKFQNIDEDGFYISNILTRCGCTVPSWNKEEILPQQVDSILVEFNPVEVGLMSNEVHVYVNNESIPTILYLKGLMTE
jgi:hypothetical protein